MKKILALNDKIRLLEHEFVAALLGSDGHLVPRARTQITPEDLRYFDEVYATITNAHFAGKNIVTELKSSGASLAKILEGMTARPLERIIDDLRDALALRKTWEVITDSLDTLPDHDADGFVASIQSKLMTASSHKRLEQGKIGPLVETFRQLQAYNLERFKNGKKLMGHSTGYDKLDSIIDGLRPEHLWVIGGYTSTGKTFASLNIASELVKQGKRVVYYSLEMSAVDTLARLLGILTNSSGLAILKNIPHDEMKVAAALAQLTASRIAIHTGISDLAEIGYSMHEEQLRNPADLFVVDFLQLVTVKGTKSEYEAMTQSVLAFQQLAQKLKVPLILLSQISNEGARAGDSAVMSFKGSGAIAAAADLAIEIRSAEENQERFRSKMQNGEPVNMQWVVRKNRHGRVGSLEMTFQGRTGVFELSEFERN